MIHFRGISLAFAAAALLMAGCQNGTSNGKNGKEHIVKIAPGEKAQEEIQKALQDAKAGHVIELAEGTYNIPRELSLTQEGVTIRGKGMDKTILSFKKQIEGAQGILVTGNNFVMEDLTVDDAKGDGVKVNGATNVTFRKVRARWTDGEKETNGAYGLYPVQCTNVLIEDCVAEGAADAGIYVGQSKNVIVRGCKAERNVAGIEIENTFDADVYNNTATNNTGGLLVFDLPGLEQKNGGRVKVHDNKVYENNHVNFAPKGTTVSNVPPGAGMMVMATDNVELYKNDVHDNNTYNLAIVSYLVTGQEIKDKDKDYDPFPEAVYVHDNKFANGGSKPGGEMGMLLKVLLGPNPVPDIVYDGIVNPKKLVDGKLPQAMGIFIENNGGATFANLRMGELEGLDRKNFEKAMPKIMAHLKANKIERDLAPYAGKLPPLPEVKIEAVK